ncbi:uncharacterized protein LOC131159828 [Malania oleifera]|uniref:uncharacterized protein LOC131159828 n=1 Tax=Malania oleifera TaxID=397392 RepID=UPI0025AE30A0|nr:uncharacterized protein LOC131159828 [Malania oleifera]
MIRIAARAPGAVVAAARTVRKGFLCHGSSVLSPQPSRFYTNGGPIADPVALEMINYALSHARSLKSDDSHAQGQLVLEQCLSAHPEDNSGGMALLAMSTLFSERGNFNDAIERLQRIQELPLSSMGIRVLALEALVGIHLELGHDDTSSVLADKCLKILEEMGPEADGESTSKFLRARAKAVKGLIEMVKGNLESAEFFFQGCQDDRGCTGNVALSYGELLHAMRNFSTAKELYQKVIQEISENKDFSNPYASGACNMSSDAVLVAANCALGQLEVQLGNFEDAQEILTKALTKTEEHFGSFHPKVGVVLISLALMFKHKARLEHSSSLLIQEGLYRRAIDLFKAPPLETESAKEMVDRQDIAALARGGYAEILCIQQNRRSEGEKMKRWAESAWGNQRLSLAEALDFSESSSKVTIIDARISRVL